MLQSIKHLKMIYHEKSILNSNMFGSNNRKNFKNVEFKRKTLYFKHFNNFKAYRRPSNNASGFFLKLMKHRFWSQFKEEPNRILSK